MSGTAQLNKELDQDFNKNNNVGDYTGDYTENEDAMKEELLYDDGDDPSDEYLIPTRLRVQWISDYLYQHKIAQILYGSAAGFFLYFAMYGLRKPFKASKFEDENGEDIEWFNTGMSLKTALVLFQLLGYMTSKWIGIKVVSEAKGRQDILLFYLYFAAEFSLVLFGMLQPQYAFIAMFLNGLPLGMVWGLVVTYFEGRAGSDFMLVCLSISFIVSSGIVKDVALAVLGRGVSDFWMPAAVGAIFGPIWLFCTVLLNQLPPPSKREVRDKGDRVVMTHQSRLDYFLAFWPGLLALWIGVMCLTAYRDYRDSFAVEIFEGMGYDIVPGTLSKTEGIIAGVLLIPIASLVFLKNNLLGFGMSMLFLTIGSVLIIIVVSIYMASPFDGEAYYIITGLGSYLAYVPYNSVLYERLIAVLHKPCTVSYLMAVMDALGYFAVFAVFVAAEYSEGVENHLDVYNALGQVFGWMMLALFLFTSFYYFVMQRKKLYVKDGMRLDDTSQESDHAPTLADPVTERNGEDAVVLKEQGAEEEEQSVNA